MTVVLGGADRHLADAEVRAFVRQQLDGLDLDGRSLCVVVPDATRRCPLPLIVGAIEEAIAGRTTSCTVLVALGTHAPMSDDEHQRLVGADLPVRNHEWWNDETFVTVGRLAAVDIARLSEGRLSEDVAIRVNRMVVESDVTLIVGPVLPHEVVGFSGGHKYLFPGLSGPELIDLTHWLGALITSREIIGTPGVTPVRALIEAAADLVPGERHALCVVVDRDSDGLRAAAFGPTFEAWSAAVDIAAETHVEYLDEPVQRVVSVVPTRYTDLWTGAKGFYKVEPIVADGGEVVLYAPHITEVAAMHPGIFEIGYHCRDYFLADWERHRRHPWGELAHSTHLYGAGTYDPQRGEHQRVRVVLATGLSQAVVRQVNLTHRHPATVDTTALAEQPGTLVVPDAGEVLYRLRR